MTNNTLSIQRKVVKTLASFFEGINKEAERRFPKFVSFCHAVVDNVREIVKSSKRRRAALIAAPVIMATVIGSLGEALSAFAAEGGVRWGIIEPIKSKCQAYLEETGDITAAIDYAGALDKHFKPGTKLSSDFAAHCWNHICETSYMLFGVAIPPYSSPKYKFNLQNNKNWDLVGCVAKPSSSDAWDLLLKSKPGDVIEYISNKTNPQHTVMVYKNNGETITIYEYSSSGGHHIGTKDVTKLNITDTLGSFKSGGISIIRCNKALPYLLDK